MATIIVLTQTSSSDPITDGSGKEFLGRNLLGEPVFGDVVTNNPLSGRTRRPPRMILSVSQSTCKTGNRNMSKSKGWTLQSSLLMLWMEKTLVNNQTTIDDNWKTY